MSGCGRYICSDECTVEKARLDFARVLISTHLLEIINSSIEVFIDGHNFLLKLVEEWGCNLGEDVFLSEDVSDTRTEALSHQNDALEMEDYQGDLDALVADLSNDWQKSINREHASKATTASSPIIEPITEGAVEKVCSAEHSVREQQKGVHVQQIKPLNGEHAGKASVASSPIFVPFVESAVDNVCSVVHSVSDHQQGKQVQQIISNDVKQKCTCSDKMQQSHKSKSRHSKSKLKKKNSAMVVSHSVGFLKRIAILSSTDRKEILKVLKTQERKRSFVSKAAKTLANSISSHTSTSSVNKDY